MDDWSNGFRVNQVSVDQVRLSVEAQAGLSNESGTRKTGAKLHSNPKANPNQDKYVMK